MKYCVDRIEENIAVLENMETRKMENIDINILPKDIKEGSIIEKKEDIYIHLYDEEEKRNQDISSRFQRLISNKKDL